MKDVRSLSSQFFCMWLSSFSSTFVEDSLHSIALLFLFVEDELVVFLWIYFSILCSVPLVCWSILLPLPSYLDYYTFIVSLEVR